ncbi:hypothetical protein [Albidovulum sp.]
MRRNPVTRSRPAARLSALWLLAACAAPQGGPDPATGYLTELPEAVAELADPSQNLAAVRLDPADGCYWYRHDGPVESTMLPLRTREGRPICLKRDDG